MPRSERRSKGASNPVDQAAELTCAAIEDRLIADEYDRAGTDPETADFYRMHAEMCEKEANKLLVVDEPPKIGAGGEVIPKKTDEGRSEVHYLNPLNTLEKAPGMVNIESSAKRAALLLDAGVLPTGLDAAHSIEAKNSLERMLAHQMALCHDAAFKTISQARGKQDTVEQVRLLNAGARLMKTFQEGALILHKLQTGGKQVVVVQHVNVTEGGQAVIAGSVGGGGESGGG
jgi:hypothetical protein